MIDGGEQLPAQIVLDPKNTRQESLQRQIDQLDNTQPGDRVLGQFLSELYQPENYQRIDREYSDFNYIRYQAKCALLGNVTHGLLGDIWGIYEYQPVAQAVKKIDDHFNIFPEIEKIFHASEGKGNRQIIDEVADTITQKTDIPVVFSSTDNSNSSTSKWVMLKEGVVCNTNINSKERGLRVFTYHATPEIYADLIAQGYSDHMDFTPAGDAIIINENLCDDPLILQTCLHELGHIVEDRFVLPQKEEQIKDQSIRILNTEIMSTLYGLKTALLMASKNPNLAFQMMNGPVMLYNWILTGTTAP